MIPNMSGYSQKRSRSGTQDSAKKALEARMNARKPLLLTDCAAVSFPISEKWYPVYRQAHKALQMTAMLEDSRSRQAIDERTLGLLQTLENIVMSIEIAKGDILAIGAMTMAANIRAHVTGLRNSLNVFDAVETALSQSYSVEFEVATAVYEPPPVWTAPAQTAVSPAPVAASHDVGQGGSDPPATQDGSTADQSQPMQLSLIHI